MTVRKRTISSLLSDLLSPISEPWNDVFQTQEKPVNALFSGIYGLLVDGRDRTTRTLDTRFWRPLLYQLSYAPICNGGPSGTRTPDQPVMSRLL